MSETKVFLLPDLGEGLTEAELVNWLVSVGDEIHVDQPIAEVETAKSMVEVPSPYAGRVAELHGEPGQTLDVGKPLISVAPLDTLGETRTPPVELVDTQSTTEPVETKPAEAKAAAETYREEEKAGSGNVLIGYGTPGGHGQARRTRPRRSTRSSLAEHSPLVEPFETKGIEAKFTTAADDRLLVRAQVPGKLGAVISPLVRRMAKEHGVDLGHLQGSGESGLIMRRDVEAAIKPLVEPVETRPSRVDEPVEAAPRPLVELAATSARPIDPRTGLGIASRTPVRGVRKAVAANMTRSRTEIPEATVWVDLDATALVEMRSALKKTHPHDTPGLLAFIARFVTAGLKKYPELNTRIVTAEDTSGGERQEILAFDGVNLGFAAQTDRGLVVPSVRNADKLTARELDSEIKRLSAVAREGKGTPAELGGGTFTLNNYGVFGVDGSAAIINHPEVAILGVGRIIDKPWVVNGELAVRKVTELTLTFDHRVCDGGTAAGFLRYVADAIENAGSVLADL